MIFEKVRELMIRQYELDEEVTMESNFKDDLDMDSLDFVYLVMDIEEEFNIEIPDEKAEKIRTVGDLVEFIEGVKA